MTLNVVGIVCALATEAHHLNPSQRRQDALASLADGTLLAVSGMGMAAAAASARALIDAGATALASWGVAGGLDPALAAGAIFLPDEVVTLTGTSVLTARYWQEQLGAAVAQHHPVLRGKLLTSARVVGSVADKEALFRDTGAVAVDMESAAVAEVAVSRQMPFIAARVIVDTARDSLPPTVAVAADGAGRLQLLRLIGALVRAPRDLGPMIRLARRYRAASGSLAALGRVGSLAPCALYLGPGAAIS